MRVVASLLAGALTAAIAILLHQSLPPLGVIASLALTYSAIWGLVAIIKVVYLNG